MQCAGAIAQADFLVGAGRAADGDGAVKCSATVRDHAFGIGDIGDGWRDSLGDGKRAWRRGHRAIAIQGKCGEAVSFHAQ